LNPMRSTPGQDEADQLVVAVENDSNVLWTPDALKLFWRELITQSLRDFSLVGPTIDREEF